MAEARLSSFPAGGRAAVIGSTGGIGRALVAALRAGGGFTEVVELGRRTPIRLDLTDEASIVAAAATLAAAGDGELRLVIDATGFLHDTVHQPEKALRQVDADAMAKAFAINAIGPALLMKGFVPLLPRSGKAVFATLSAKVGSIGDNHLGGWYSYRASKAALNQIVRTAAVEVRRTRPEAICVALHPGTVDTGLSGPFAKTGLDVMTPAQSAAALLSCIDGLGPADSGGFFDRSGQPLPF